MTNKPTPLQISNENKKRFQNHIKIDKGFSEWNKWIKEQRALGNNVSLSGINIDCIDLTKIDLADVHLANVIFFEVDFFNADLNRADMNRVHLYNSSLRQCKFIEGNLERSTINDTNFNNSDLSDTNFRDAEFSVVDFSNAKLKGTNFESSTIEEVCFYNANLCKSNFRGAKFDNVNFTKANLTGANLSECIIDGCLHEANLTSADLSFTDLSFRKYPKKHSSRMDLKGANLSGANLKYANLNSVDLSGSILTGANIYEIQKDNWILDNVICEYIYVDFDNQNRIPCDRDFEPREFEALYTRYPTFEYFFSNGMHPLAPWVADQIIYQIREQTGADIHIETINALGHQPSIRVQVKNKEKLQLTEKAFVNRMKQIENKLDEIQVNIPIAQKNLIYGDYTMSNIFNINDSENIQIGDQNRISVYSPTKINLTPSKDEVHKALDTIDSEIISGKEFTAKIKLAVIEELKQYLIGNVKNLTKETAVWVSKFLGI